MDPMCRKIRQLAGNTSQLQRGKRWMRRESPSDGCVEDAKSPRGEKDSWLMNGKRRMPGAE
jgi:hypothetical protein